jgi:mannose/cellobiose epimerase-like protein (N-acyl-D-glucosamine 2-epimerase family)
MALHWLGNAAHKYWLQNEEARLLGFGRRVVRDDNLAAWLDDSGVPEAGHAAETWITARMAHVHYLGALRGVPGAMDIARKLMRGIDDTARDQVNVILASSTGTVAGDEVARRVLDDVLTLVDEKFWQQEFGRVADTWSADWSERNPYRGINANMHMVEAMLAASDATGDTRWAARAVQICEFVLAQASNNGWRIPEHFDDQWTPNLEFNRDQPADQFKPYGATVGHAFEWSRLIAQAAPLSNDAAAFVRGAEELFGRGAADGWGRDGHPGFVYTTDWSGEPVVSDRLHWVVAEAIAAAAVLHAVTGNETFAASYETWWDYAATYFIDLELGSWRHQLDARNQPSSTVWEGKPDIYHAYQAVLICELPVSTSVAKAATASELG